MFALENDVSGVELERMMSCSQIMYRNAIYNEYLDYNVLELGECAKDFIELAMSCELNKMNH